MGNLRAQFKTRLGKHICGSLRSLKKNEVFPHLEANFGVQRNGGTYIELACQVASFAEREDLLNGRYSSRDLRHLLGHGGIGIRVDLLDFPSHGTLLIKLKEVSTM